MDSILTTIKKLLGITKEDTSFDQDVIVHINSVFLDLTQIGVGPSEGFFITDETAIWGDFVDDVIVEAIKSYMYLKVRLLFDPPTNSAVIESMNKQIDRLEWRINVAVDSAPIVDSKKSIDYRSLTNLPTINGTTLIDNYDEQDPNVEIVSPSVVDELWNADN